MTSKQEHHTHKYFVLQNPVKCNIFVRSFVIYSEGKENSKDLLSTFILSDFV